MTVQLFSTASQRQHSNPWLESRWAATKEKLFADYARDIQGAVKIQWMEIAGAADPDDIPQVYRLAARANHTAARSAKDLSEACVDTAFDEESISLKARNLALKCLRLNDLNAARMLASREGIIPPDQKKYSKSGQSNRLKSEKWWRRKLHVHASRRAEGELRERGLVHRQAGLYCSNATLERRKDEKRRQREFMAEITAISDLGDSLPMTEIIDASMANPALRRAELMTRISGFEDLAKQTGHTGVLLTFTAPSRFHCRFESGKSNPKYEHGNSPRASQKWLRKNWSRIRSQLHREEISPYGFRIAEPHHDGTTHWHMLLFVPADQLDQLLEVCRKHSLRDAGSERGAQRRRFDATVIDPAKGSAAGYIAKYLAKNIDGFGVGHDHESNGSDALDTVARVDAWAATWGIRRFQQIGGPPVGVWRELRRVEGSVDSGLMEAAREAADEGDWGGFIEALGGIESGRQVPVTLEKQITGEVSEYGELKAASVVGLRCAAFVVFTREKTWLFVFSRDFAASWTCVNNYTVGYPRSCANYYSTLAKTGPPIVL